MCGASTLICTRCYHTFACIGKVVVNPLTVSHRRYLLACGCIKPTIFPVLSAFQPPNSTHMTMQQSSTQSFVTLTTPTHQGPFNSHGSLPTIACLDQEKRFTARNGGPTRREDCFLSPFVQRRAHPAPTKSFSRPSPEDIAGSLTSLMKVSCRL